MEHNAELEQILDETVLAVDYGEANIGLAFGRNGLAMPLTTISGKHTDTAIKTISDYALENRATRIVVGLPLNQENKEGYQARKVRRFAKLLKIHLKKPLEFVDEYNSTNESMNTALKSGVSKKRRKNLDHLSAAVIVKNYYAKKVEELED